MIGGQLGRGLVLHRALRHQHHQPVHGTLEVAVMVTQPINISVISAHDREGVFIKKMVFGHGCCPAVVHILLAVIEIRIECRKLVLDRGAECVDRFKKGEIQRVSDFPIHSFQELLADETDPIALVIIFLGEQPPFFQGDVAVGPGGDHAQVAGGDSGQRASCQIAGLSALLIIKAHGGIPKTFIILADREVVLWYLHLFILQLHTVCTPAGHS